MKLESTKQDIIGLSEINPKNFRWTLEQQDLHKGYTLYDNRYGRGVALYVRFYQVSRSKHDNMASVWCELKLKDSDKLLIGVVYRSPASTYSDNKKLLTLLTEAVHMNTSHILISGDFNYLE